uniref:Uncharacterized protein n=1 Tax=Pararge aegeria TaxID=116150 RepID=S4P6X1_9NEOP
MTEFKWDGRNSTQFDLDWNISYLVYFVALALLYSVRTCSFNLEYGFNRKFLIINGQVLHIITFFFAGIYVI